MDFLIPKREHLEGKDTVLHAAARRIFLLVLGIIYLSMIATVVACVIADR